jgi:hypothetical protein
MHNETQALAAKFAALSSTEKQTFLLRVMFDLTLECRDVFSDPKTPVAVVGRSVNELQNKLASHALAQLQMRSRYPDDVLFQILEETASAGSVTPLLDAAISRAFASQLG